MDCSPSSSSVHGVCPGKNTAVDCHLLLQGIFWIQGLNSGLLRCRRILYRLSHQGSVMQVVTLCFSVYSRFPEGRLLVKTLSFVFFLVVCIWAVHFDCNSQVWVSLGKHLLPVYSIETNFRLLLVEKEREPGYPLWPPLLTQVWGATHLYWHPCFFCHQGPTPCFWNTMLYNPN